MRPFAGCHQSRSPTRRSLTVRYVKVQAYTRAPISAVAVRSPSSSEGRDWVGRGAGPARIVAHSARGRCPRVRAAEGRAGLKVIIAP